MYCCRWWTAALDWILNTVYKKFYILVSLPRIANNHTHSSWAVLGHDTSTLHIHISLNDRKLSFIFLSYFYILKVKQEHWPASLTPAQYGTPACVWSGGLSCSTRWCSEVSMHEGSWLRNRMCPCCCCLWRRLKHWVRFEAHWVRSLDREQYHQIVLHTLWSLAVPENVLVAMTHL